MLTDTAEAVLQRRYYLKDSEGNCIEDWDKLCRRVARAIASVEPSKEKQEIWEAAFYKHIYELDFLPNSPCLMNAGTDLGQLSACFVLPVEDSMEGIFTAIRNGALVHKSGGGTGYSFSRLRPKNSNVQSTQGVASGPLSFMQVFDSATEVIKQGGKRRGANMGVLRCLAGKTKIHTLNGRIPINELVGKHPFVYCCDPLTKKIHIAQATKVFISDTNREMVRVHFDNDTSIDCTLDHRFLLSSGNYIEAQNLETGSSIMAFSKVIVKHGKALRFVKSIGCTNGRSEYEHRVVAKDILLKEVDLSHNVHHIDGNSLNNIPDNLEVISKSEHAKRHDSNMELNRKKVAANRKGRTLEEVYGKEKADAWKQKMREAKSENLNHKVVKVEYIENADKVYDITVPNWHNFVAEEVFVHNCDHPDILDFIEAKKDQTKLTNFNLSVACTDTFMNAVIKDTTYALIHPCTKEVVNTLSAKEVYNKIIDLAWYNGEPGIIFIDTANNSNPTPELGEFEATNPCGEQWLLPYESCNLGSINLANYVVNDQINWDGLSNIVHVAVRFLDNVVDCNKYLIPEIAEMTLKTRKLGLGIMGLHDMLIKLSVSYNSVDGRSIAGRVMQHIKQVALEASHQIGVEKGFIADGRYRNAALTSIQPTGTVSMIANCASGCEPYFSIVTTKNVMDNDHFIMVNPLFESIAKEEGFYSDELMRKIADTGTVIGHKEIPVEWQDVFRTAQDIPPFSHIDMQAKLQVNGVDSAISKTINLPNSATKENIAELYINAWHKGCKGLTIYRDGSRDNQVLTSGSTNKIEPMEINNIGKEVLPDVLNARRYKLKYNDNQYMYVIICFDEQENPKEIFAKFPFDNRMDLNEKSTMWTTTCRLVSLALRCRIPIDEIIKQLDRSSGSMYDLPAQLGKLLKSFMSKTQQGFIQECPECKQGSLIYEEGCEICKECGYSKCS